MASGTLASTRIFDIDSSAVEHSVYQRRQRQGGEVIVETISTFSLSFCAAILLFYFKAK